MLSLTDKIALLVVVLIVAVWALVLLIFPLLKAIAEKRYGNELRNLPGRPDPQRTARPKTYTAKKYDVGDVLRTRDGRKIGNAIITEVHETHYVIETDFGNTTTHNDDEIDELFYVQPPVPMLDPMACGLAGVTQWRKTRASLIGMSQTLDEAFTLSDSLRMLKRANHVAIDNGLSYAAFDEISDWLDERGLL